MPDEPIETKIKYELILDPPSMLNKCKIASSWMVMHVIHIELFFHPLWGHNYFQFTAPACSKMEHSIISDSIKYGPYLCIL